MYKLYKKAGYRQMMTLKTPDGMSLDELKDWWVSHSNKMKNLPGLHWYTISYPLEGSPFGPPVIDGFEEFWFSSLDDLKKAYASEIMQSELEDMKDKKLRDPGVFRAVWLEENIVELKGYNSIPDNEGMVRLVGLCIQPPNMTKKDLVDWYYQHAERVIDKDGSMIIPGIKWYTHSFVLDDSPFGKPAFHGLAENWWLSLDEIKEDFESDLMKSQLKDREDNIDIIDESYFEGYWCDEIIIDLKK